MVYLKCRNRLEIDLLGLCKRVGFHNVPENEIMKTLVVESKWQVWRYAVKKTPKAILGRKTFQEGSVHILV